MLVIDNKVTLKISSKMVDRCKDKKILPERSGKFVWRAIWRFNFCPAVSCFTQDWKGCVNYLCPPFDLVHRALVHAKECGEIIVIIVPIWVAAPWWPMVLSIKREEVDLPPPIEIIQPGPSDYNMEPCNNSHWKLRAI